jgi:hypothetical protein
MHVQHLKREQYEICGRRHFDQLKMWQQYFVLVNRIDTSKAPDIDWPMQPE